jgi:hypothetical protein
MRGHRRLSIARVEQRLEGLIGKQVYEASSFAGNSQTF